MYLKSFYFIWIGFEYKLLFKDKVREGGKVLEIVSSWLYGGGGVGGVIMVDCL